MAWTLRYSTHQHTVSSRRQFSVPNLASLREAALKISEIEQSLPLGTVIGYADTVGPDERHETLRRTNIDYKLI